MTLLDISVVLSLAGVSGILAKVLKQPLIIGYLFAGVIASLLGFVKHGTDLDQLGQIGVTLLLFLVGLEMNFRELSSVGKSVLVTAIGQIVFTTIAGFFLSSLLGFGTLPSLYISIALTLSSTIIIIKLLSEKNDLDSLYGKIAIGFLLVQDLLAIILLMFLSSVGRGATSVLDIAFIVVKAVFLFGAVWYLSKKILPYIFEKYIASSMELLFIVSLAWALGFASFVAGPLGFTFEVGGFLAGIALSNINENTQIAARTRPLRDFFLTIFFLSLGTKLIVGGIGSVLAPAIIFSIFVLIGNPLIVLILMGILGHRKRTSFLASVTVAQISEFSLVIVAMGATLGHLTQSDVAVVILVGVITMTASTYLILRAERIFESISKYLSIFEKKKTLELVLKDVVGFEDHVVLLGAGRTGQSLLKFFKRNKIAYVVVDFNPQIYTRLIADGHPSVFGDISEDEILKAACLDKAKMVISTTPSFSDNSTLIKEIRKRSHKILFIAEASERHDAIRLYEMGADYVILPTQVTGEHIKQVLKNYGLERKKIKKAGKNYFSKLLN